MLVNKFGGYCERSYEILGSCLKAEWLDSKIATGYLCDRFLFIGSGRRIAAR